MAGSIKDDLYAYRATIVRVVDGDTAIADIDLGLHIWVRDERLRLARINAPETQGSEKERGLKAKAFLKSLIEGKQVLIRTKRDKKGKYGRYLAEIELNGINVNDLLVAKGCAVYKNY